MPTKTIYQRYSYRYNSDDIFNGTVYNQTSTSTKTGVSNPQWRLQVRASKNAGTPYTCDITEFEILKTEAYAKVSLNVYRIDGTLQTVASRECNGVAGSLDLTNVITEVGSFDSVLAEAQALSKLYKKIQSERETASGMVFLGELRETIHFLKRPASAIQDLVEGQLKRIKSAHKAASKLRIRKGETLENYRRRQQKALFLGSWKSLASEGSSTISGTWLEFVFGVKPLLNDCEDIAKAAVEAYVGFDPPRERITGKSNNYTQTFFNSTRNSLAVPGGYGGINYTNVIHRQTTYSIRYVVGIKPAVSAPIGSLELLTERLGIGMDNFVPTLWELMPWSFLIDYFVNIGNILEASFTNTDNVIWVSRTDRRVTIGQYYKSNPMPYSTGSQYKIAGFQTTQRLGALKTKRTRLTRTIPSSLPLPPLTFSIPGSDSSKWYNMAALLEQSRKKFTF